MESIKELKQLIIHACENWLRNNLDPNAYLSLTRTSIEELLIVLKSEELNMDKGSEPVYAIYMMEKPYFIDETGWPNCGIREFTGFYHEKDVAIRAVEENWCDIQDHCFHAAEICEIVPGLYPNPPQAKCLFYEWNVEKEKFERKPFPKLGKEWDDEFKKE